MCAPSVYTALSYTMYEHTLSALHGHEELVGLPMQGNLLQKCMRAEKSLLVRKVSCGSKGVAKQRASLISNRDLLLSKRQGKRLRT